MKDLSAYGQRNYVTKAVKRSDFDYDEATETLSLPYANMPNKLTNFDGYTPPFIEESDPINIEFKFNIDGEDYFQSMWIGYTKLDRKNKVCTIKEKHTGGIEDDKKSKTNIYTRI
ncbi:hypothetical protein [Listeria seeligeri]|uniref:hypothetical protein n=1 Tax=Listeria seeligeri TaxID=1640 RepID=UPI0015E7C3A6|nr:hypothetical protein [Listeria seeligeri]MBF2664598.1 hypothetical protein [Listeria seeligeri]